MPGHLLNLHSMEVEASYVAAQERRLVIRQQLDRQGREEVLGRLNMVEQRQRRGMDGQWEHQHSVLWIRIQTKIVNGMQNRTGTPNIMDKDYVHCREGRRW